MTIKALRSGYGSLSLFQRLALADNAVGRDDESEALAINAASPRVHFSRTDFADLFEKINSIRLCNLIVRLGYLMNFDFLLLRELEALESKSRPENKERIANDLRLAAFLYVRATDAWKAVNDELGLRKTFDLEIGETLFAIDLLQSKEALMRNYAFTEDEARKYVLRGTGRKDFKTIADEIEEYRTYLELG